MQGNDGGTDCAGSNRKSTLRFNVSTVQNRTWDFSCRRSRRRTRRRASGCRRKKGNVWHKNARFLQNGQVKRRSERTKGREPNLAKLKPEMKSARLERTSDAGTGIGQGFTGPTLGQPGVAARIGGFLGLAFVHSRSRRNGEVTVGRFCKSRGMAHPLLQPAYRYSNTAEPCLCFFRTKNIPRIISHLKIRKPEKSVTSWH